MKIVCISDTHRHRPEVPSGDILIFAGDDDINGMSSLISFANYIKDIDCKHKIVVPGNHDFWFERGDLGRISILEEKGIKVLIDEMIEIEGLKIYGTPYTPIFMNWAFMESEEDLRKRFFRIPEDIDILVTHGPACGVGDQILPGSTGRQGESLGSLALAEAVSGLKSLKLHVYGHIHGSYGKRINSVNASICDEAYTMANKPIIVEV